MPSSSDDSRLTHRSGCFRMTSKIIAAVGGLLATAPLGVFGLGVRIPNQDAEAIARGNAFAATANNPSALYYNPAGISQLHGTDVQIGVLSYLGLTSDYRNQVTGASARTDYEIVPVPQLYATYSPGNSSLPLSYGLGVYAPFGLGLHWPEDGPFRQLAIEGRITYITIQPTIALQLHPTLSIGVGPTLNYSHAKLRQGIGITPTDQFSFRGEDWDFGYHVGVLWKPIETVSVGANYRSPTTLNYHGPAHFDASPVVDTMSEATVRTDFPQIISGGISYRPAPEWNFEVDVDWTDWNCVDTLVFKGAANPFTGNDISLPLNWHASWFYHVGGTRYFENGYFVSAGYFFSQNSTSEKNFTPYVPDTDLHVGSIGGGYKGRNWNWALAAQLITGAWRTVNGSTPSAFGQSADGQYKFLVPAVTCSLGYRF